MKNIQVFLVFGLIAYAACGPVTPQRPIDDSQEFDDDDTPFGISSGVVDTAFPTSYFGNPFPLSFGFSNPFAGFWQQMEDSMRQLQQQMTKVLSRLPEDGNVSSWQPIAEGKGNTTSTVKVINGHKVTINETVYADEANKDSGSFFKIRIVQVKPTSEEDTNSGETLEGTTVSDRFAKDREETTPKQIANENEVKGSPETFDETDNEIPQSNQAEKTNPFDRDVEMIEDDSIYHYPDILNQDLVAEPTHNFDNRQEIDSIHPVKEIETNDVNSNTRDLSNDIYINQMLADQGYPQDPRAEVFEQQPTYYPTYYANLNNDAYNYPRYYYGG